MSRYVSLREECCEVNRKLAKSGLVDLTFGNVSVLLPEEGVFAIKPSGVDYSALKSEYMVVLDMDGKVVEGAFRPSSDTPTHRRLFLGFEGARSIVHTHSRKAVAFAQAGMPIPCLGTTHADYFHGEVPVTREMTTAEIQGEYEWETGGVILERFRGIDPMDVPAVLVRGHAPFAWGPTPEKALETALALEIIAGLALDSLLLNPSAPPLQQDLLARHFLRKHGTSAYYGQH